MKVAGNRWPDIENQSQREKDLVGLERRFLTLGFFGARARATSRTPCTPSPAWSRWSFSGFGSANVIVFWCGMILCGQRAQKAFNDLPTTVRQYQASSTVLAHTPSSQASPRLPLATSNSSISISGRWTFQLDDSDVTTNGERGWTIFLLALDFADFRVQRFQANSSPAQVR